jgi:hypothetical protein
MSSGHKWKIERMNGRLTSQKHGTESRYVIAGFRREVAELFWVIMQRGVVICGITQ